MIDNAKELIKVCRADELKNGEGKQIKVFPKTAAVFKIDDKFYGMDALCKHMKASLVTSGKVKDCSVTCLRHGWKYDIPTGKCSTNDHGDIRIFKVYIEDGFVCLDKNEVLVDPEYYS